MEEKFNKSDLINQVFYCFSLMTGLNTEALEESDIECAWENIGKMHYIELQSLCDTLKPLIKSYYL